MENELLEKFLSQYNENEAGIIREVLEASLAQTSNLMGKVLDKDELQDTNNLVLPSNTTEDEKARMLGSDEQKIRYMKLLNKWLLWDIRLNAEKQSNKRMDSLTEFLIMTHDEPQKRREILDKLKSLTDTTKKDIILRSITSMMGRGNVTLDDVFLDCCSDEAGIVLNAKFDTNHWFTAIDNSIIGEVNPAGHWITFISDRRPEKTSAIDVINEKRHEEEAELLNHDNTTFELGLLAERYSLWSVKNMVKKTAIELKDTGIER